MSTVNQLSVYPFEQMYHFPFPSEYFRLRNCYSLYGIIKKLKEQRFYHRRDWLFSLSNNFKKILFIVFNSEHFRLCNNHVIITLCNYFFDRLCNQYSANLVRMYLHGRRHRCQLNC